MPDALTPNVPAFATVTGWGALSGMSRSSTYEALAAGHLRAVKLGARTLIDVQHGLRWVNSLPPATIGTRRGADANRA